MVVLVWEKVSVSFLNNQFLNPAKKGTETLAVMISHVAIMFWLFDLVCDLHGFCL